MMLLVISEVSFLTHLEKIFFPLTLMFHLQGTTAQLPGTAQFKNAIINLLWFHDEISYY